MLDPRRVVAELLVTARLGWVLARAGLIATTVYLDVLTVAAARQRRRSKQAERDPATPPTRRFAVLIPAHDEERLIAATVTRVIGQDYPSDLFGVHVVADNCTDGTAAAAAVAGAEVHERTDPTRPGKGPALQWLMAGLDARGERPDAYVFIDADTLADPSFLTAIDRAMAGGATVVQGHYAVRDAGDSPVVAFRAAAMALRNFLRPLGRTAIGGSAGLYGNGMAFAADVMRERRWTDHLTEDVELHLDLLLDGTLVAFAPDAVVTAEMPDTLAASESQHERWEGGRLQLARRYLPRLKYQAVAGGPAPRVAYADAAMDLLVPPLSVVVAATAAWAGAAVVRAGLPGGNRWRTAPPAAALAGQAAAVLAALRFVRAPASVYRSLLTAPRMVAWKLGLWARVALRPDRARWTRTARN
jgi:cellulose synthase/poly-beta-1,6-N-acetylglucosamine synthase-like glycosyltransferase